MQFRTLLTEIARRYPAERRFTSSQLASLLGLSRKGISNSLRRIYQMGFLKRCRRSRKVLIVRATHSGARILECCKGFEYLYSLSKQGLSYVNWLHNRKPFEDSAYLSLTRKVMEALPEQLRFDLEILSALRGTFKYQGPTRQLRLIDNPVNSLLILSARNLGLQRENQRLGVACFKAMLEAGRSESVAKQAEERAACGGIPVSLLEPDRTATITIDQALQEQLGSQDATCPRHIEAQEEASIRLESEP